MWHRHRKDAGDRLKGRGHGSSVYGNRDAARIYSCRYGNEGIIACREALTEYGDKLAVRIAELEKQIYEEAGEEFNINSPKQLGVILFENCPCRMERKQRRVIPRRRMC